MVHFYPTLSSYRFSRLLSYYTNEAISLSNTSQQAPDKLHLMLTVPVKQTSSAIQPKKFHQFNSKYTSMDDHSMLTLQMYEGTIILE